MNTKAEIVEIDCYRDPEIPDGLRLKNHCNQKKIKFILEKMIAMPVSSKLKSNELSISLSEAIKRFRNNRKNIPVNANVLDHIKRNIDKIPKKFGRAPIHLLFLETTFTHPELGTCIRALNFAKKDGKNDWYETKIYQNDHLSKHDLVICIKE